MLTRAQANQAYKLATTNGDVRALAQNDLFFLLVHVLGRADIDRDWLYDRCREVQAAPDGYLDLWAREHYKSTIITYGLTIQNILNNPQITIGIFSHTRPIAKGFLSQIKRTFGRQPGAERPVPGGSVSGAAQAISQMVGERRIDRPA